MIRMTASKRLARTSRTSLSRHLGLQRLPRPACRADASGLFPSCRCGRSAARNRFELPRCLRAARLKNTLEFESCCAEKLEPVFEAVFLFPRATNGGKHTVAKVCILLHPNARRGAARYVAICGMS